MRDVANPIAMTSLYTTFPGYRLPVYQDILLKDVHSVTAGWVTLRGLDAEHKMGVTLDNVTVDGVRPSQVRVENADRRGGCPLRDQARSGGRGRLGPGHGAALSLQVSP